MTPVYQKYCEIERFWEIDLFFSKGLNLKELLSKLRNKKSSSPSATHTHIILHTSWAWCILFTIIFLLLFSIDFGRQIVFESLFHSLIFDSQGVLFSFKSLGLFPFHYDAYCSRVEWLWLRLLCGIWVTLRRF